MLESQRALRASYLRSQVEKPYIAAGAPPKKLYKNNIYMQSEDEPTGRRRHSAGTKSMEAPSEATVKPSHEDKPTP